MTNVKRFFVGFVGALLSSTALAAPPGSIEGKLENLGSGPFVVYIDRVPGFSPSPSAPTPVMGQAGNTYIPHLLPIVAGSKVEFQSKDPELHNVFARDLKSNQTFFNIAMRPKGPPIYQTFSQEGVVRLTCNIHKEMLAFIVVLQNPYFAVVEKGAQQFRLEGAPPGKHTLRVWGERLSEAEIARRFPVEVKAGETVTVNVQGGQS